MTWWQWLAPVVGLLLLGFLWIFLDGVLRDRRPPVDGAVLALLVAVLHLALSDRARPLFALVAAVAAGAVATHAVVRRRPGRDRWRRQGPWTTLLFGLPELVTPVAWLRALWRWTSVVRWWLRRPRVFRAFRRLGYRRLAVAAELSRWFTPAQVRVLAWDVEALTYATAAMARVRTPRGWDAEAFVRAVRACGHDVTPHLGNWAELHRLGVDDPAGFLRYVEAPDTDLRFALRYAVGRPPVPFEVVLALRRLGVTKLWAPMARLQDELRVHGAAYPTGWTGLLTWLEHAGADLLTAFRQHSTGDAESYFREWRTWTRVSERAPRLEAALWSAAGFTVDGALAMLDCGEEPDPEVLLGLAALRRTA